MTIFLRQSTASQEIPLGYFVDSTDGDTAETALSIANTDIKLWKSGATSLADKTSGGATHMAGGLYSTVLDATDSNTIGPMIIFVHVAGALTVRVDCCVLDELVYDVLFGTTAPSTLGGTAQTGDVYPLVDAEIATLIGLLDTEIAALISALALVKAKTDSLTFTIATVLDANVQRINDVVITGDGSATPFGV